MDENEEAKTVRVAGVSELCADCKCGERDPLFPRHCVLPAGHRGLHEYKRLQEDVREAPLPTDAPERLVLKIRQILQDERAMKVIRWLRDRGYSPAPDERTMRELEEQEARQ